MKPSYIPSKHAMRYSTAYPTGRELAKEGGLVQFLSKRLFWDVSIESVEEDSHKRFIIQRVLERGSLEDIRRTVRYYSLAVVIEESMQIRSLDPMTLAFASCLANAPKESFKCYALNQ